MARTGSCHFQSVSRQAELASYGEWQEPVLAINKWQEPVLAISKASRDRAELGSYGEWQEPVLAFQVARTGSCRF